MAEKLTFQEFSKISSKEWEDLAKQFKLKSPSSSVFNNEKCSEVIDLYPAERKNQYDPYVWGIREKITYREDSRTNQRILKALSLGCNSIHLIIRCEDVDFKVLFQNVDAEFIDLKIEASELILKKAADFGLEIDESDSKYSKRNFRLFGDDLKKFSVSLKETHLKSGLNFQEFLDRTYIEISLSEKLIAKITHVIALHKIIKLCSEDVEGDLIRLPRIEAYSQLKEEGYQERNLINLSVQTFAGVVAGVDCICLDRYNEDEKRDLFWSHNIQHILSEESELSKIQNAAAGSTYFEDAAHNLVQKELGIEFTNFSIRVIQKAVEFRYREGIVSMPVQDLPIHQNHEGFAAGLPPFLRGPYASMYLSKPWTIRQYAGFSTAEESNAFYKRNLAEGQKGLSVAFDLATHRGYDSDHVRVNGDIGMAGVAIDSVEDMKKLFDGIPLDQMSVSMTMNGAVLPIMAFYIAAGKSQGVELNQLSGTIQNDILKEFMVRNTYIYPPQVSMRIVGDIFEFTAQNMPKFNSISISGYHMQEAGASADIELAYTLADGLEYVKKGLEKGLDIDEFAPRLSFFWGIGMGSLIEIAKMRAARILWAKLINRFNPKNPKSMTLRTHCQTSGWSLTEQDAYNNIPRTTFEALAAILGGTQSLHTNAFDEAVALPTDFSAKIARDTQLFLQDETDLLSVVDPFGGSYYIEYLTAELATKAWTEILEIEKGGGMTSSIEKGIPKHRIESSSAKRQARIDSEIDSIIGLNKYQSIEKELEFDILEIDNSEVQIEQFKRIKELKNNRSEKEVQSALQALKKCAESKEGNLLALSIVAAESGATLGEMSFVLEEVFGRYQAQDLTVDGVYSSVMKGNDQSFKNAVELAQQFKIKLNRKPKVLIAKVGQDGHDRGAKIVATAFSDIGFEVIIGPLFQTPQEAVELAFQNKVDVLGVSSLAGGHKTLVPEILKLIEASRESKIQVVAGGVIPKKDREALKKIGAVGVYGPGSKISEVAIELLNRYL